MAETTLIKKLLIKPNQRILLLNAPQGYRELLGALPEGVTIATSADGEYDAVHLFAAQKADLEANAPIAIKATRQSGVLWISYPKKTGKIKSDLTRDIGWKVVDEMGWQGVTQISIDDTWSALRFRPASEVGT
jgi:hypothetical protein